MGQLLVTSDDGFSLYDNSHGDSCISGDNNRTAR